MKPLMDQCIGLNSPIVSSSWVCSLQASRVINIPCCGSFPSVWRQIDMSRIPADPISPLPTESSPRNVSIEWQCERHKDRHAMIRLWDFHRNSQSSGQLALGKFLRLTSIDAVTTRMYSPRAYSDTAWAKSGTRSPCCCLYMVVRIIHAKNNPCHVVM